MWIFFKNQSRQWNWDHEHQDHQPSSRDWDCEDQNVNY